MTWWEIIKQALAIGATAYREGQALKAQGEAVKGEAIVARMHQRYQRAKDDSAVKEAAGE